MWVAAPEMGARDVLGAFHRDAPYLFLGAAFVAVGVVSAAFAAIRRRHDPLLVHFALFAVLYGLRLWIQARLLGITIQGSTFYTRLRSGVDYIVPIPAVLFFNAAEMLSRAGRIAGNILVVASALLAAATFIFGDSAPYRLINNVVVIAALIFFITPFVRSGPAERDGPARADFAAIRWGLLAFVALALWENIAGVFSVVSPKLEPFGFAAFLGSLGYVAARRTLQRDQQLDEIQ